MSVPDTQIRFTSRSQATWLSRNALAISGVLVVAALILAGAAHPIQDNNEGLYARVAHEMLERGDWIVPYANGVPYLEKPPLLYWLTAVAMYWFGPEEIATRAASLIGALLAASAVWRFAERRWSRSTAVVASCILAASPLWLVVSHALMFEALLTGLLAWALVELFEAMESRRFVASIRISYAALALAGLAKGLVAVALYGLVAFAMFATSAVWRGRARRLAEPGAIAIFAGLFVPWHVWATVREPGFAWFYFINEHFLRYLDLREPRDYYHGPWWYYLPRVLAFSLPWIALLLFPRAGQPKAGRETAFMALACLVPLVFFSLSGAKANYYMAVSAPALAVLLADRVECAAGNPRLAFIPGLLTVLVGLLAVWGAIAATPVRWPPGGTAMLFATITGCAFGWLLMAARHSHAGVVATAAAFIPLACFASACVEANSDALSAKHVAEAIKAAGLRETFIYRDYESISSLPHYLGSTVGIIDSSSNDLAYGIALRPDHARFIPSSELNVGPDRQVAIVAHESRLGRLLASPLAARLQEFAVVGRVHLYRLKRESSSIR